MSRAAEINRETNETHIRIKLELDGSGQSRIDTGIPFLDHMLTLFARHGFFDLDVDAKGDLEVDCHHTMEDIGIVLGNTIKDALGDKRGIRRYGAAIVPMDESLARVVLDLSGRPWLAYDVATTVPHINNIDVRLFREMFQALTNNLMLNLHIDLIRGEETHHILEAVFKAFAKALDQATRLDTRETGVPSTKGTL